MIVIRSRLLKTGKRRSNAISPSLIPKVRAFPFRLPLIPRPDGIYYSPRGRADAFAHLIAKPAVLEGVIPHKGERRVAVVDASGLDKVVDGERLNCPEDHSLFSLSSYFVFIVQPPLLPLLRMTERLGAPFFL